MSAAAVAMILASCSKEGNGENENGGVDSDVAYLSIKVDTRQGTRGSDENAGTDESGLFKLYMITFNNAGKVVPVPDKTTGVGYNMVDVSASATPNTPEAVKVSSASKKLVVIANPGEKLKAAIEGLTGNSTIDSFKTAIAGVTAGDIEGGKDVGFAMITGGSDTDLKTDEQILYPYVEINGKIQPVDKNVTPETAKTNAEKPENRLSVNLERLASKIVLKERKTPAVDAKGATFELTSWTVDAVNSTYYPFAEKTILAVAHNPAANNDYSKNFYTKDPNFANNSGIKYAKINAGDYDPILPWGSAADKNGYYGWKADGDIAYVIENTMEAAEQRFENATRVVVKAKYFPATYAKDQDWFSWANKTYESLGKLQTAYGEATASGPGSLKDACDRFFSEIQAAFPAKITATKFADLTPEELDTIPNGGEVVKQGKDAVILWYQKGLCYYYYFELRHDNVTTERMAFGKYGAVRNNWYDLTVNSVSNPGTPWYPDIENPGPGDPDPKDPIDDGAGYLGIGVTISKWIIWGTGIDF